jgi:phage baseplate assembly protein W
MDDFKIISIDERTRRVTIKPGIVPKKVSGIDKLIQIVIMAIYTDPGRNVFSPDQGSGLPSLIGTNINPADPTEALADVTERIEKIRDEILENQNALENESSTERLADLQVLSIDTGVQIDEVIVELKLISEAGGQTTLVL